MSRPKTYDPEESLEDAAIRRIDQASEKWAERSDKFIKTLRANARHLSPYRRQTTGAWMKLHCERLQATLEERDSIPPLHLDSLPDLEN